MVTISGVTFLFLLRSNRTWVSNASSIEIKTSRENSVEDPFHYWITIMHNTKMLSFKSLYFNALKKLFIFSYKERETIIKTSRTFHSKQSMLRQRHQYAQKWKGSLFQSAKMRVHCVFQALVPILIDHRCSKSMGIGLPSVTVK